MLTQMQPVEEEHGLGVRRLGIFILYSQTEVNSRWWWWW